MNLPGTKEFQKIYAALQDDVSREIYKRRLLYSLLSDRRELTEMIRLTIPETARLHAPKICFYGGGTGFEWLLSENVNLILEERPEEQIVIDNYRTGSVRGHRIVTFEEFQNLPDCREYLILITVEKKRALEEIEAQLDAHGFRYVSVYREVYYKGVEYFDLPYMNLDSAFYVDAGALDGGTAKYFLNHFQGGFAYVFEPSPEQFEITREALRGYSNAECFPFGLYDKNGTVNFTPTTDDDPGRAKIMEDGDISIEVRRLDDILGNRPVTFIKMDIEDSELAALRGAERIIRQQRPKLAICVYHKPEDMWEIPNFILNCHPDYKLYLRHYTMIEYETVLYAI